MLQGTTSGCREAVHVECWMKRRIQISIDPSLGVAGQPWRAQEVAARQVVQVFHRDVPVVELGSGCGGLASFLALEGYRVVATDLPDCSRLVSETARCNEVRVPFEVLPWGDWTAMEAVLATLRTTCVNLVACELAYWGGWSLLEEDPLDALVETLTFFLTRGSRDGEGGGLGLLVYEARNLPREAKLFQLLETHGLEWKRLEPDEDPNEGEVGAWLVQAK
ncbi:unnamed protein product, partial [Durusdinium trenchii]